jgi:arsenate reductase-like glutaredoxin family protein
MTTIAFNINKKSKKYKAVLAFLKAFDVDKNEVELIKEPKSPCKKEFVAKLKRIRKEKGREIFSVEDFWENTDNL